MITKYKIEYRICDRPQVTKVEVERETQDFVYLPETRGWNNRQVRVRKRTTFDAYFDSYQEALRELADYASKKNKQDSLRAEESSEFLRRVLAIEVPTEEKSDA